MKLKCAPLYDGKTIDEEEYNKYSPTQCLNIIAEFASLLYIHKCVCVCVCQ